MQYTYCPISHEVKATDNEIYSDNEIYKNITRHMFFFKIHAENEAGKLVPDVSSVSI